MDKLPDSIKKIFVDKNQDKSLPDNLFAVCPGCQEIVYRPKLQQNLGVCPLCSYHFRISSEEWIEFLADEDSFTSLFDEIVSVDPLNFPGYKEKLEELYKKGINEGIKTGYIKLDGIKTLIGVMDADFIMGSMGSVVGERVTRLFEYGMNENLPVIIICRSGGARMQEGVVSLFQMAKTSAAAKKFSDSGNLYISILTDPTTGGVSASFAFLGDIIIAEPGALIGFAGQRVIEQTIKQKLPEGFQRAEFLEKKGFIDIICDRRKLKETLVKILEIHRYRR
ncbi:MAG TPA: acetyl-CoA carboxylase, carboxyltransferase subunit beta [Exilispira sp.]|nr:acetyl-CoA carboxylase, carboxyltransferase subunit beta [Exilispira sp.]